MSASAGMWPRMGTSTKVEPGIELGKLATEVDRHPVVLGVLEHECRHGDCGEDVPHVELEVHPSVRVLVARAEPVGVHAREGAELLVRGIRRPVAHLRKGCRHRDRAPALPARRPTAAGDAPSPPGAMLLPTLPPQATSAQTRSGYVAAKRRLSRTPSDQPMTAARSESAASMTARISSMRASGDE